MGPKHRDIKVFESWPHEGETKQALPVNLEYGQGGIQINDWGLGWETRDGQCIETSFTDNACSGIDLRRQEANQFYELFVDTVRGLLKGSLGPMWRRSHEASIEFAVNGPYEWKQRGETAEQHNPTYFQITDETRLDIKAGKSIMEADAIIASLTNTPSKV